MGRTIDRTSSYADKVIKLIPAEWVSAYVALKGMLDSAQAPRLAYYAVITVLFVLLPVYLRRVFRIQARSQIAVTTISFAVWVFSLGGDHVGAISWYEPYQGSICLIVWTLIIPNVVGQRGDHLLPGMSQIT